jgi:hypothetical protein
MIRKRMNNKTRTFLKALPLILIFLFCNVGVKFPVMSETTDIKTNPSELISFNNEEEKYFIMYQEIYKKSLIQQIEFESEILIPDYIDFKYVEYIYNLSNELGLSRRMIFRLVYKESTFRDNVISPAGAKGLMQLMPDTRTSYAKILCVDTLNLDKNQEDILIGMYYIKELYEFWTERGNSSNYSLKLSFASYNAGQGKVLYYKGIPPYIETTEFVNFIVKPHSNPVFYSNILEKADNSIKDNA